MNQQPKCESRVSRLGGAVKKYQSVILVIVAGLVLLLLPSFGGSAKNAGKAAAESALTAEFDLDAMEQHLSKALSSIEGAGKTRVVLTLKGSARQIVAKDSKTSEQESTTTTVVVSAGSGSEDTVVLQEVYPQYQGALVICPGGEDPAVRLKLVSAVAAVTGLGTGHISVCKGN